MIALTPKIMIAIVIKKAILAIVTMKAIHVIVITRAILVIVIMSRILIVAVVVEDGRKVVLGIGLQVTVVRNQASEL